MTAWIPDPLQRDPSMEAAAEQVRLCQRWHMSPMQALAEFWPTSRWLNHAPSWDDVTWEFARVYERRLVRHHTVGEIPAQLELRFAA